MKRQEGPTQNVDPQLFINQEKNVKSQVGDAQKRLQFLNEAANMYTTESPEMSHLLLYSY